jgi:septum formation protein
MAIKELPRIILASQSPRRKTILEWAEVDFEVIVKHSVEDFPPGTPAAEIPVIIAHQKALAVKKEVIRWSQSRTEDSLHLPILAADTIVVLDGEILGKPVGRAEAISTLQKLSGKTHHVITGVVIYTDNNEMSFSDTTEVTFHTLTIEQIEYYVDKYKPYDKAGGYAIQEWIGVLGIKSIVGDFYNVMGLPISRVIQALSSI